MHENPWSNDELRTFLAGLRGVGFFGRGTDDDATARFRIEAARRIAPEVQRRVLADVGAVIDTRGVATVALEVAEDTAWEHTHTWLMVTEDPWAYLADLVTRRVRKAYRRAARSRDDEKALRGIAAASSRPGIEG